MSTMTKAKLQTFKMVNLVNTGPCYHPSRYLSTDWQGTLIDILDTKDCPAVDRIWICCKLMNWQQNIDFANNCAAQAKKYAADAAYYAAYYAADAAYYAAYYAADAAYYAAYYAAYADDADAAKQKERNRQVRWLRAYLLRTSK